MTAFGDKKIILAIETSIGGGSLALLSGRSEIVCQINSGGKSRSEGILEQVAVLLEENGVFLRQVKQIAVSKGAGSITGEKIGLAIAVGFAKALNARLFEIPILEAMLLEADFEKEGYYLTALPAGKSHIIWQQFLLKDGVYKKIGFIPVISTADEFQQTLKKDLYEQIILTEDINRLATDNKNISASDDFEVYNRMKNSRKCLAELIGLFTMNVRPITF
jgi:tRNA threonylcarbamoyl adenosine modification protein YeaZ